MRKTRLRAEAIETIERALELAQANPSLPRQKPYDLARAILTELSKAGIGFARR